MMTKRELESGIRKLQKRMDDLKAFDWQTMSVNHPPELTALENSIDRSLEQIFGKNTSEYTRYSNAAQLQYYRMVVSSGQAPVSLSEYRDRAKAKINSAIVTLGGVVSSLEEDLEEIEANNSVNGALATDKPIIKNSKIFIVHGHDEAACEKVARFLSKLNLEPIILHEQANSGRTIIEKIEANSDVSFAVVLLTPDDFGGLLGGDSKPRARQNVILELGYFFGKLGRENVCALRKGDTDIPNDFAGVVWTSLDDEGWKISLCRELKAADYEIDMNQAL